MISLSKSDGNDDLRSLHINLSPENERSMVNYNSSILNNLIIFNYTSTAKCLLIITISYYIILV
jgi:hypothetical protein